jgi:hypothetical protein
MRESEVAKPESNHPGLQRGKSRNMPWLIRHRLRRDCDALLRASAQDSNSETIQSTMSGAMIDPTQLSGEQLQYMKQQIEDVRILASADLISCLYFLRGLSSPAFCPPRLRRFLFCARDSDESLWNLSTIFPGDEHAG